jgi:hypothetical protein
VLPLQAGVALDGRLELLARPKLRLRHGAPAGGDMDLELRVAGVAAHDAQGAPLDLGELRDASLFVRAAFDAGAGSVRVDRLVLDAGPLSAHGSGGIAGLPLGGGGFDASALTLSETSLVADADLDRLAALLGRVADPGGPSFSGSVHLASTLSGGGQRLAADTALSLVGVHVDGVGVDALQPLDLQLRQRGTLDLSPGGRSEIEELTLVANALDLRVTGGLTDLADPARREGRLEPVLVIHTSGAGQVLGPLLDGLTVAGEDVRLQGVLDVRGPALGWSGELTAPSLGAVGGALGSSPVNLSGLQVSLQAEASGPGQPVRVPRLDVALGGGVVSGSGLPVLTLHASDLAFDTGSAVVRALTLETPGLRVDASGEARGFLAPEPEAFAASGTADVALQPDVLSARFGALLGGLTLAGEPLAASIRGGSADGRHQATATLRGGRLQLLLPAAAGGSPQSVREAGLALDLTLRSEQGGLALAADAMVKDLDVTLPGATPLHVHDPELRVGLDADVELPALDVTLRRAEVASTFVTGSASGRLLGLGSAAPRAQGLRGDFRYVPDRLAALLGPLLPVRLSGDREERLEFEADGPLAGADLRELLAGLTLDLRLGTGTLALPGLQLGGTTTVSADDGTLRLGGELAANGGTVVLDGAFDLRRAVAGVPAPGSQLKVTLAGVRAGGELGRALAACHPLFASAGGQVGDVDATMDAGLQLAWDGELPLESLLAGAAPASLKPLTGSIDLSLGEVTLASSALMSELLSALGQAGTRSMTVDKLALAVRDGRLHYTEPWDVRLAGVDTSFGGSVGLDGTLDLAWSVPVTAELVQKHKYLKRLQGQPITIPLVGRIESPKLRWSEALADLAEKAAQQELEDRLKGKLGGLGGLVGGEESGGAGAAPADDPEQILSQADALWSEGKPDEARPLYKRLKDDFKLTLTYLLNKDRIDERAKKPKKG